MSGKCMHVVFDLCYVLEIIERLLKGEVASSIVEICGVGLTAMNEIKRDTGKIVDCTYFSKYIFKTHTF